MSEKYEVTCPYCTHAATLVNGNRIYPHRADLHAKYFWLCAPCRAYVGCHPKGNGDGTKPLGRLANTELREAKKRAHAAFDPIWLNGGGSRSHRRKESYKRLAKCLDIEYRDCHIGMFDIETCEAVVRACQSGGM